MGQLGAADGRDGFCAMGEVSLVQFMEDESPDVWRRPSCCLAAAWDKGNQTSCPPHALPSGSSIQAVSWLCLPIGSCCHRALRWFNSLIKTHLAAADASREDCFLPLSQKA